MLQRLEIENLALINRLELEFEAGLNLITGETGAGKSILLDALGLALGFRGDAALVKNGAEMAKVQALFSAKGLEAWLEEKGLASEGGELWLKRELSSAGRSRAWINGQSSPLSLLAEIGERLADYQGQHEHQSLLKTRHHRRLLDEAGQHLALLKAVREAHGRREAAAKALESQGLSEEERLKRMELLKFQASELEEAGLKPGERQALEAERSLGLNSGKRSEALNRAAGAMLGTGEEGALSMLERAGAELRWLKGVDPAWAGPAGRFDSSLAELKDLADAVELARDKAEYDPRRAEDIEARLHLLEKLGRKYQGDEGTMLETLSRVKAELESLENMAEGRAGLEAGLARASQAYEAEAKVLSKAREKAGLELSRRLAKELESLGMPKAKFEVSFRPLDPGGADGAEEVEFLLSANPGEDPRPLAKVASGGELSRVTLALKSALASSQDAPVMIFDEVDSGISGRVADIVGEKIESLAKGRQVLCITHLPQIASRRGAHILVEKAAKGKESVVAARRLGGAERERELAQMLSGRELGENALAHARDLLKRGGAK